jgi:hypothetical protein
MSDELKIKKPVEKGCPFTSRSCSDDCALHMVGQGGQEGTCAFSVIALSLNQQLVLEAQAMQAQQDAFSRAIMSQAGPRSGSGLSLV